MSDYIQEQSGAWKMFSVISFVVASVMMAGGIFFMEASFAAKGFYGMASLMLVHSSISMTKTLRDEQENKRMIRKIEDAKTEKLLREVG